MKPARLLVNAALLAALLAAAGAASAHGYRSHSHARLGLYFGVPLALPYYYPPSYYYPPRHYYYSPPVAVAPPAPTVYLQQDAPPPPPAGYWYYCRDPQGYYPQVPQCPTPWQQVPAQPSIQ